MDLDEEAHNALSVVLSHNETSLLAHLREANERLRAENEQLKNTVIAAVKNKYFRAVLKKLEATKEHNAANPNPELISLNYEMLDYVSDANVTPYYSDEFEGFGVDPHISAFPVDEKRATIAHLQSLGYQVSDMTEDDEVSGSFSLSVSKKISAGNRLD